jgi:ribosomal protein L11 methyltransferase
MAWWQLTVHASTAEIDMVEAALLALGSQAITLTDAKDEPIYEPLPGHTPLWSESLVTGLFDQSKSLESLYDQLVTLLPDHLASTIKQQLLEDQIWERTYLDYFKPTVFGDNLWIIPSWHKPVNDNAVNITLDPGLAFGTGSHPTTALCLEWLDQHPPKNKTVIDFGCGSGILGIAAILLDASHVLFTDIDPQALDATLLNAQRNHLDESVIELKLPHDVDVKPVDVLVANILSGPLVELENHLASLVKTGGKILLSGILPEQTNDIMNAYSQHFNCDPATIKDNWVRITGTKK